MLRNVKDLFGYAVRAEDDEIGSVDDCYFDDQTWDVRYVVVDTGSWLTSRKVLVSPQAIGQPDWYSRSIPVSLTRDDVKNSPDIDTERPVSRQQEAAYFRHYGWTPYWGTAGVMTPAGALMGPPAINPAPVAPTQAADAWTSADSMPESQGGDPHLRSTREVTGYRIHALDDEIGHVDDLILDTDHWAYRYLVVDTRNWLPGKKVLVPPTWVESIDFQDRSVRVDVEKARIAGAPEFDPSEAVNRAYEERLYDYYGRPVYWR